MRESANRFIRANVQRMRGYTPGEQPVGERVIKLNTNENPYPPSPRVSEALSRLDPKSLGRYPDPLAMDLRRAIAELHGCEIQNVFAGNGSDEALALCLRAFVEDGGSVGYFEPSYSLYPVLADIQGAQKRPLALGEGFEWRMEADYSSSLFFLANPNAPTSILYDKHTVAAFCRDFDGVVVIDEAYVDFSEQDCLDLALEMDNVLVARTLSKSYSLAGLRLGYLIGCAELIAGIYKIKDSYNLNRVTQDCALAAIEDQAHMRANCERILASRTLASERLRRRGFEVFPSQTNFLWVRPDAIDASELFQELKSRSIHVRHFAGELTGAYLRITIGTNEEMDSLISAIDSILGQDGCRER